MLNFFQRRDELPDLVRQTLRLRPGTPAQSNQAGSAIMQLRQVLHDGSPNKSRPAKRRAIGWKEVRRDRPVHVIGDLNGSADGLIFNLLALGLIEVDDGNLHWIGGNAHLILLGDIFADRIAESFEICQILETLREQIELDGGSLTLIAGNHDHSFSNFFDKKAELEVAFCRGKGNTKGVLYQGTGLLELKQFGSKRLAGMDYDDPDIWDYMLSDRPQILEKMRGDELGKLVLETRCSMKLLHHVNDHLFEHCPLEDKIAAALIDGTQHDSIEHYVEKINFYYRESVWNLLFGDFAPLQGFAELDFLFLDTNNRTHFPDGRERSELLYDISLYFRKLGVNTVFHGHQAASRLSSASVCGLDLINVDNGAFCSVPFASPRRSVTTVSTDGSIFQYENRVKFR